MALSYKKRAAARTYSGDNLTGWDHTPAQWNVYDCDGSHVAIIEGSVSSWTTWTTWNAYDPNTLHTISRRSFPTLRALKADLEAGRRA
jgi:hypothetical protein